MAEATFLMVGDYISRIKGCLLNLTGSVNKSFPKSDEFLRKLWTFDHHITYKLCNELDNDICRFYPMNIRSINDKLLTSIFYTTEKIEDPFKHKPYEGRNSNSKLFSQEEQDYLENIIRIIRVTQELIAFHPELFGERTIKMTSKLDTHIHNLEYSIWIMRAFPGGHKTTPGAPKIDLKK